MKYTEFAQKIKAKYPEYQNVNDLDLANKIVNKYPQYKSEVDFDETIGEVAQGTGRSVGNLATFGQAPHIAGLGQALGGSIYNLLHKQNPFKDVEKDYAEGREDYKQEQNKFKTLHPVLNTMGEIAGAITTLPLGGAVAKVPRIAQILKGAGVVKKGALAGAGWGATEGFGQNLSNTEGKAFDLSNAIKGGTEGALLGGTIGTAIPLSVMGVKGGINAIAKLPQSLKSGIKGDVIQYTVPNGVQTKAYKKLAENPTIQKEAIRGDIGMRSQEFQDKASEKTIAFVPELFEKVSKDYEALPKDIFISFDKMNTGNKLFKTLDDFRFDTKFMPNENVEKEANKLVQKILKAGKTVNNEYGITRENLQRAMNTAWEKSQKAFNNGDNAVGKLYSDIYKVLREARATNGAVEKASAKYHDIQQVKEKLEKALQVKFEKGANHRQVATKLIQEGRNRAGTQFDEALMFAKDTLSKYKDLPNVKELSDAIDLAQVSYDFRPPTDDKLLNRVPTGKGIVNKIFNMAFDYSPQEKAKLLAKNLKEGTIKPEDVLGKFDIVNAGKFSTGLNRFLQNQRIYGSKLNPIARIMRSKKQLPKMPLLFLEEGNRINSLIRNPLIFEANKRKQEVRKLF